MDAATGPTTISSEMAAKAESHDLLTLGVEEEYLLVDTVEPLPAWRMRASLLRRRATRMMAR